MSVLVHGAFADGSTWSKVIPLLQSKGFHVRSVGIPLTSFADDVAATKRVIAAEEGSVPSIVRSGFETTPISLKASIHER